MSKKKNHGIVEVATLTPSEIAVGDPMINADYMIKLVKEVTQLNKLGKRQTRVVVFPELALTGYNCAELFNQSFLHDESMNALEYFMKETNSEDSPLIIIGAPIKKDNQLFNCAVVIFKGEILGIVPKTYLPNYTVLYEARYFHPSTSRLSDEIELFGKHIPFTPNLIFKDETSGAAISVELCEDLWMPLPPSAYHCIHGANIVANLSSSNQVFGKTEFRQALLKVHSTIKVCGYIYTCATDAETTTDSVFAGHNLIVDNGIVKGETKFFDENEITYGEIDIDLIETDRVKSNTYMSVFDKRQYKHIVFKSFDGQSSFHSNYDYSIFPFVPENIVDGYKDVLDLQTIGLSRRLRRNQCDEIYLIARDTANFRLALIVSVEAFKRNHGDTSNIYCVLSELEDEKVNQYIELMNILNVSYVKYAPDNCRVIGDDDMTDFAVNKTRHIKTCYDVNASIPKTALEGLLHYYERLHMTVEEHLIRLSCNALLYKDRYDPKLELEYMVYDFILHHLLKTVLVL